MTSELLSCIEIDPGATARSSIVWLHGLGADGHDFEPLASQLALPEGLGVRFVFPHAPHRPVTINGGFVMRAWYDILSPDLGSVIDEQGIRTSVQQITRLIDAECARGIPPARIILAGFSQGGAIALEAAAHYADDLGGVLALSTYVPLPEQFPAARGTWPIFMAHGLQDPIVPYSLAERGRAVLERKGYAVEWHRYPMPHSVCLEEIQDFRTWLLTCLESAFARSTSAVRA